MKICWVITRICCSTTTTTTTHGWFRLWSCRKCYYFYVNEANYLLLRIWISPVIFSCKFWNRNRKINEYVFILWRKYFSPSFFYGLWKEFWTLLLCHILSLIHILFCCSFSQLNSVLRHVNHWNNNHQPIWFRLSFYHQQEATALNTRRKYSSCMCGNSIHV